MRIMIIGGTGFIGTLVTERLVSSGHDVTLFNRDQTESDLPPAVTRIYGDRRNLFTFRNELERRAPQVVVDMIAYSEHDARSVMAAFRGMAERVVAISSMDVYKAYGCFTRLESGPAAAAPLTEESPLRERLYPYRKQAKGPDDMAYNYEKILVEKVVLHDSELSGTVLRLPKVYGPGDGQHHLLDYVKRMADGRSVILLEEGQAQWRWTRGYVENVAAAIALAATDKGAGNRVYNVGEETALTEADWVESIGEVAGWRGQVRVVPRPLLPNHLAVPFDWSHNLAADTSRLRTELSYNESVARADALKQAIAWEQQFTLTSSDRARFDYNAEDTFSAHTDKQDRS